MVSNKWLVFSLCLASTLPAAQAAETCLQAICVDQFVADRYGRVGKIVSIRNGEASFVVNGSNYTANVKSLTPEDTDGKSGLKIGAYLVDRYNRVGKVRHSFKDGRAEYEVDGSMLVDNDVVPEVESIGELKPNGRLVDEYNRVGDVEHVFRDGRAAYRVEGSPLVSSRVSPSVSERSGASNGIQVVDEYNRVGTARTVFADGRVEFICEGGALVSQRISAAVPSLNNISRGKKLIDEYDRVGDVEYVFGDGRAAYRVDGNLLVSNEVSPSTQSLGEDGEFKDGVLVADRYDRAGKVSVVFEDGRVSYTVDGSGAVMRFTDLSPEVELGPRYDRESYYATSGLDIGKPLHAFKDGRVQMESIAGGTRMSRELYPQAESVAGFSAGSIMVDPTGMMGSIAMVFENGTVALQFSGKQDGRPWTQMSTAKILGFGAETQEELEADLAHWIRALEWQEPRLGGDDGYRRPYGTLAVGHVGYPVLRAQLLALLRKNPELVYDKALRKKIEKNLGG